MTKTAEKPYPLGRTYLYSSYKGVSPPPLPGFNGSTNSYSARNCYNTGVPARVLEMKITKAHVA